MHLAVVQAAAQTPIRVPSAQQPAEHQTWWYVILLVLAFGLAAAALWMLRNNKADREDHADISEKEKMMREDHAWETSSIDGDQEMPRSRRHRKSTGNAPGKSGNKNFADKLPKTNSIFNRSEESEDRNFELSAGKLRLDLSSQPVQPPIFKFQKLELARPFAALSISGDEDLMSAIEQAHDEFETDEEIRDLAVRILTRFKTRNSVEALTQVALYDLSSTLRSKAVTVLVDFDHESVFETILLCCADPTREVRAAAARGLFRLSLDRADAWTRIAESGDGFRMRQAAQAARAADLVKRSFDRLAHRDRKIAYEAAALLALMIRAGETDEIFNALLTHHDSQVKLAIAHVIGLTKAEATLPAIGEIRENPAISNELKDKLDEVVGSFAMIPA